MNNYFDNATTSWPKSKAMRDTLATYYDLPSGSYGRSVDKGTMDSTQAIELLRTQMSALLGGVTKEHIVFNSGATESINTILRGIHLQGRTLWISPLEHNAVMRPFYQLTSKLDLNVRIMPALPDGRIDVDHLKQEARPGTALAIINLESNVNGVIQPIESIAKVITGELGIPILADASQYLGYSSLPKGMEELAFIVFSGHKGLLGPSGTGGFFVQKPNDLRPLIVGSNGFDTENYTDLPSAMPARFSAGTPNMPGLVALSSAVANPQKWQTNRADWQVLFDELERHPEVRLLRAQSIDYQGPIFSLVHTSKTPKEISEQLRCEYDISAREGLQCAPLAHQFLGTLPEGTLRISFSPFHTSDDLERLLQALTSILR